VDEKDKTKVTITDLLKSHPEGLTIADIMRRLDLARHTVLARLHALIGESKVKVRQVNMAKVHYWQDEGTPTNADGETSVQLVTLTKEHVTPAPLRIRAQKPHALDMIKAKERIEQELRTGKLEKHEAQIQEQRLPIAHVIDVSKHSLELKKDEYIKTGIEGLDALFQKGIPKASTVLFAGGAGSGKTILGLQILANHAAHGEKCLYMSFEESEDNLVHHMLDFGWDAKSYIEKGILLVKRFNPFDITRSVDALLMDAKGELLIEVEPVILPEGFKPTFVVVDSLTAIASAFSGKDTSYRIYIEQLFRFFEKLGATAFLITETKQVPTVFSSTGVEEFLADGVIVLYSFRRGNVRENAVEVLKLRGAKHQKKIVAMQITDMGIVVYPQQEVFGAVETPSGAE